MYLYNNFVKSKKKLVPNPFIKSCMHSFIHSSPSFSILTVTTSSIMYASIPPKLILLSLTIFQPCERSGRAKRGRISVNDYERLLSQVHVIEHIQRRRFAPSRSHRVPFPHGSRRRYSPQLLNPMRQQHNHPPILNRAPPALPQQLR